MALEEEDDIPAYVEEAKFIEHEGEVDDSNWPREPSDYRITNNFRQRFKEFGGILNGDIVSDAIKYGTIWKAKRGCVAFSNDLGGVVYFFIAARHVKDSKDTEYLKDKGKRLALPNDAFNYKGVSIWPYVYSREEALDTGRWSPRQLNKIQDLYNEEYDEAVVEYMEYVNEH